MKKGMLMLALVGLLVTPAMADWDHPFKVDQLYPVSSWGAFSHIDTDSDPVWAPQIADDWLCTQSEWVTDLHLNGWSQYGPTWVDAFHITIWNDVPAGPDDESHPGYLMAEFDVFPDEIEGPSEGFHYDDVDDIWAINFPEADWFWQEEGNIYWISAQGVMFEDGYPEYFAWNFAEYPVSNNDDAVLWDDVTQSWRHWGWFWADDGLGGLELVPGLYDGLAPPILPDPYLGGYAGSADMSFALTPEPATLVLVGFGALALLRRR